MVFSTLIPSLKERCNWVAFLGNMVYAAVLLIMEKFKSMANNISTTSTNFSIFQARPAKLILCYITQVRKNKGLAIKRGTMDFGIAYFFGQMNKKWQFQHYRLLVLNNPLIIKFYGS